MGAVWLDDVHICTNGHAQAQQDIDQLSFMRSKG